jgi:hypothetical protein
MVASVQGASVPARTTSARALPLAPVRPLTRVVGKRRRRPRNGRHHSRWRPRRTASPVADRRVAACAGRTIRSWQPCGAASARLGSQSFDFLGKRCHFGAAPACRAGKDGRALRCEGAQHPGGERARRCRSAGGQGAGGRSGDRPPRREAHRLVQAWTTGSRTAMAVPWECSSMECIRGSFGVDVTMFAGRAQTFPSRRQALSKGAVIEDAVVPALARPAEPSCVDARPDVSRHTRSCLVPLAAAPVACRQGHAQGHRRLRPSGFGMSVPARLEVAMR